MARKKKTITIEQLTELMRAGCERADQDEARDMQIHAGDPNQQMRAWEYRRGKRHGMDDLLMAAERMAK